MEALKVWMAAYDITLPEPDSGAADAKRSGRIGDLLNRMYEPEKTYRASEEFNLQSLLRAMRSGNGH